jgi:putative Holliday junction resolvase
MGLDVGDRRIGVAVSDELGMFAQGIEVIERRDIPQDMEKIRLLLDEYRISELVVGIPWMLNGTLGIQGEKVMTFVESLKEFLDVPIALWDERLSSRAAEQVLLEANMRRDKRKKVIDRLAAAIILQNYMDSRS